MFVKLYKLYRKYVFIYPNLVINNFFSNFLLVTLFISGYYSLAAEVGVIISLTFLICNIFSGNLRSIIIADKNLLLADEMLFKRILLSLLIIIIIIFFIFKNNISDISLALATSILVLLGWIFEIMLTKFEISKKIKSTRVHLIVSIIFMFSIFIFGLTKNLFLLKSTLYLYLLFLIILILLLIRLNIKNFKIIDYNKNIFQDLFKSNYISSLSTSLSNFLFRYFLILFLSKDVAGILFACFMVGSFPGSLFNQIFGATFIHNKISLQKIFFPIFTLSLIALMFIFKYVPLETLIFEKDFLSQKDLILTTIFYSVIGLNIMITSLYIRQKNIFKTSIRENFFIIDMFYSLSVILSVPLIYFFFGATEKYFTVGFFLCSIFSLIFYTSPKMQFNLLVYRLFLIIFITPIFFMFYDGSLNLYLLDFHNIFISQNNFFEKNRILTAALIVPFLFYFGIRSIKSPVISIVFILITVIGIININLFRDQITIENHINLVQLLFPIFFLILGEIFITEKYRENLFFKYSFWILSSYILLKNIFTLYKVDIIENYFTFLSKNIFHTQDIFILFFCFYCLYKIILNSEINKLSIHFLFLNILLFCLFKESLYLIFGALLLFLYLKNILKIKSCYFYMVPIFFVSLFYNYDELIVYKSNYIESLSAYTYQNFSSVNNFLFGSNIKNELYDIYLSQNYFIDLIYNFGFICLVPIIFLFYYSFLKLKKLPISVFNNEIFFFILFSIIFPLFSLSLNDIYVGSFTFLYWSIILKKYTNTSK
tara:strand:- start:8 stop:2314 length:2307 start_codon:yes stop_codon:yes gene_type:complete